MQAHRLFNRIRVAGHQRLENIIMLAQHHIGSSDVIEAHVAHPLYAGLNLFNGIPGELAVGNLRKLLMKLIIQLVKIG